MGLFAKKNRRRLLPNGYTTSTGRVFSKPELDNYNRIQSRMNAFIDEGRPPPSYLFMESFNAFCLGCYGLTETNKKATPNDN